MIPNDAVERRNMISRMLNVLGDDPHSTLNKWESDFVESLYSQFEKKGTLSNRQCEILEKIYDKIL